MKRYFIVGSDITWYGGISEARLRRPEGGARRHVRDMPALLLPPVEINGPAEARVPVMKLCHKYGFPHASYHSKYAA